jgi:hypothetical protein
MLRGLCERAGGNNQIAMLRDLVDIADPFWRSDPRMGRHVERVGQPAA